MEQNLNGRQVLKPVGDVKPISNVYFGRYLRLACGSRSSVIDVILDHRTICGFFP